MRDDEASYLLKMFRLTDAGVVERVYQQSQLQAGELSSLQDNNYAGLMQRLGALPTPEKLLPVTGSRSQVEIWGVWVLRERG